MKLFWIILLVVSIISIWVAISLPIELKFGIDMPYVELTDNELIWFGYEVPPHKQWGLLFGCGVFLMLSARLMHLSLIKLNEKNVM